MVNDLRGPPAQVVDNQRLTETSFTNRANVAYPCKLNADSFRARYRAMGYLGADEKPKEQNPNRNLHWRPQPLHGQIPRAEEGHYSPELCGRRSNPQLNKNLRNSLNTKGLRGGAA